MESRTMGISHDEIRTMERTTIESARWKLDDGIRTMESARWNPHDGAHDKNLTTETAR